MSSGQVHHSRKAALVLVAATFFWAASFPVMKALAEHQQTLAPGVDPLFLAAISVVARFGLAALLLAIWYRGIPGRLTAREFRQGAGLGFFGGLGILLQMHGLTLHIAASTSAFLTQCYCIFVPVVVAWQRRAWPSKILTLGCVMVLAGVAELSDIGFSRFRLGQGEVETIVGSLFFTGQILWLERPCFAANRAGPVTLIMFAGVTLLALPVAVLTGGGAREWEAVYSSGAAIGLTVFLSLFCTLAPYEMMNYWQRHIPASHASLIYAAEPLITSVLVLFAPAWLSRVAGIHYANERMRMPLLIGGGLITAANILVLWQAAKGRLPIEPPENNSEH